MVVLGAVLHEMLLMNEFETTIQITVAQEKLHAQELGDKRLLMHKETVLYT